MAGLSDLPNEIISLIWHSVAVADVYNFSVFSKRIYQWSKGLLPEHHRLKRNLSTVSNKGKGYGVFAQTLKEVLKTPRAALYPSVLKVESWQSDWTTHGLVHLDMKCNPKFQADLDLFEKTVRSTNLIEEDRVEDWIEAMRSGNEEPLIAPLLMHLPNLEHLFWKGVVRTSIYTSEMLNTISMNPKCFSLNRLEDVEITHMAEESNFSYADLDLLRCFANIPSVTHIKGDGIASYADDIEALPPPFPCNSNPTSLRFVNADIDPKSMSELLSTTHRLEDFYYAADDPDVGQRQFNAFWIRTALVYSYNARNTLKSLTLLAHAHAHTYMGILEELPLLEYIETNLRLLIGDPAQSIHMPSSILPGSIKEVVLHVRHAADAPYYMLIVHTTASCFKYYPHLSEFTLKGIPLGELAIPKSEIMVFHHTNTTFSFRPKPKDEIKSSSGTGVDKG